MELAGKTGFIASFCARKYAGVVMICGLILWEPEC